MAIDRLVAPLLRVPILAGLKPLQITEIARQSERLGFNNGEVIIRAGAAGDGAYLIVSGLAECIQDTDIQGGTEPIEPGSLVGEMAMLVEHEYRSTVVARDRVLCLKISRAALQAQMLEDPSLARHFEWQITERLKRMAQDLRHIDGILVAYEPLAAPSATAIPRHTGSV
jgi:CRP-like cAMP-binding protein